MRQLSKKKRLLFISLLPIVLGLVGAVFVFSKSNFNIFPQLIESRLIETSQAKFNFPEINESSLSISQQQVVAILRQEYAAQPDGTKYSENVSEPWCADFASWVFKQAGVPLSNPNTGYWRIPGTYTLRDYYEQENRFKSAQSGYSPKVGDIMLYDNPSPFGQHTNIVIKNENGILTTIGGNEPGGIRIVEHKIPEAAGFIGFGIF